jgi:hypothetical protein
MALKVETSSTALRAPIPAEQRGRIDEPNFAASMRAYVG